MFLLHAGWALCLPEHCSVCGRRPCREELLKEVAAVEDRLRKAEDAAFEQEARAAALELELFRSMDEDHERALQEVGP